MALLRQGVGLIDDGRRADDRLIGAPGEGVDQDEGIALMTITGVCHRVAALLTGVEDDEIEGEFFASGDGDSRLQPARCAGVRGGVIAAQRVGTAAAAAASFIFR